MLLSIRQALLGSGWVLSLYFMGKNHCRTSVSTQGLASDVPAEERKTVTHSHREWCIQSFNTCEPSTHSAQGPRFYMCTYTPAQTYRYLMYA